MLPCDAVLLLVEPLDVKLDELLWESRVGRILDNGDFNGCVEIGSTGFGEDGLLNSSEASAASLHSASCTSLESGSGMRFVWLSLCSSRDLNFAIVAAKSSGSSYIGDATKALCLPIFISFPNMPASNSS